MTEYDFIPRDYFCRLTVEEIFPNRPEAPLEVDVGSGDGTFVIGMAEHFPERNFLAIERLGGRVNKTCRKAQSKRLQNVKVLRLESGYTLTWLLPHASVDRMHLLFADPWPKKKHAEHRFLQGESLTAIHNSLKPQGQFLFKTDDQPYFEEGSGNMDASVLFKRLPWEPDAFYPITDFEAQWLAVGRDIFSARWEKN